MLLRLFSVLGLAAGLLFCCRPACASLDELSQLHLQIEEQHHDLSVNNDAIIPLRKRRKKLACKLLLAQPSPQHSSPLTVSDVPGLLLLPDTVKALGLPEDAPFDFRALVLARRQLPERDKDDYVVNERELASSRKYALFIRQRSKESLLLLPSLNKLSIAGFDGVIYDESLQAVANYSLKNSLDQNIDAAIAMALEKAEHFSDASSWLPWKRHSPFNSFLRENYRDKPANPSASLVAETYARSIDWLKNVFHYLGLNASLNISNDVSNDEIKARPYRVVLEIVDADRTLKRGFSYFEYLQKVLRKKGPHSQSITLLLGNVALEITADDFHYHELSDSP